jgi:hypothetical protein
MPIPPFDDETGYLPPGEHEADWTEVYQRFGWTYRRRMILAGLRAVLDRLWERSVTTCWFDGSFVTSKQRPRDVDVIYLPPPGSDVTAWGDLSPTNRSRLKDLRQVDLWPYPSPQPGGFRKPMAMETILEFFSHDRDGRPKGLIIYKGAP